MENQGEQITAGNFLRYVRIGIIGVVSFALATAVGVLSMTPPEYNIARSLVIGAALGTLLAIVLWLSTSIETLALKLSIAVFFVFVAGLGEPLALWWIGSKESNDIALATKLPTAKAIADATLNLSELDDNTIREKVTTLANELRDFELKITNNSENAAINFEINQKQTREQQNEAWREHIAKLLNEENRNNNEYRRFYLSRALALLGTIQQREGGSLPEVPSEARPALVGSLAGVRPASALADYLEKAAATLPP